MALLSTSMTVFFGLGALAFFSASAARASTLTASQWQILKEGILNPDGPRHYLEIEKQPLRTVLTLGNEDPSTITIGKQRGAQWIFTTYPNENLLASNCWNVVNHEWVTPSSEPAVIEKKNRLIQVSFDGTGIPLDITMTPISTKATQWQTYLHQLPTSLKLKQLSWPTTIYLMQASLKEDVMCQGKDHQAYPLPHKVTKLEEIKSRTIAQTLFTHFKPWQFEDFGHQFVLKDDVAYEWRIHTLSTGLKVLALSQLDTMEGETELEKQTDYYALENNMLIPVQVYRKFYSINQSDVVRLTFPPQFSQELYQHFDLLAKTP